MIVFFRDTTQQRRILSALIDSETKSALKLLASAFAREVKPPLKMLTKLFLLARAHCSDPEAQAYLRSADQQMHRISEATRTLLGPSSGSSEL